MWAKLDCPHAYLCKTEGREEYDVMIESHTGVGLVGLFSFDNSKPLCGKFWISFYILAFCRDHSHAGNASKIYICPPLILNPAKLKFLLLILLNNAYCHMHKSLKSVIESSLVKLPLKRAEGLCLHETCCFDFISTTISFSCCARKIGWCKASLRRRT